MKAVILCAGYATRLYPLCQNRPKALLPVRGRSILEHLLDDLASTGAIDGYVIVTNHRFAGAFDKFVAGSLLPITLVDDGTETNETRLGAVRDLELAIRDCSLQEDLLVAAGDNVLDFSLARFLSYAQGKGTTALMRYYEPDPLRLTKSGVVEVDGSDRVLSMEEKPEVPRSHWCAPPFYCLKAADAQLIPDALAAGCGGDSPGRFIAWLCANRPVYSMEIPGKRYDIGNLASYEAVQREYRGIREA